MVYTLKTNVYIIRTNAFKQILLHNCHNSMHFTFHSL